MFRGLAFLPLGEAGLGNLKAGCDLVRFSFLPTIVVALWGINLRQWFANPE